MKILLDYFFPITSIEPTPQASTAFLKQACVVVKPKSGQEGNVGQIFVCTNMTQVAAHTDNTECQNLFDGGMSKVYLLLSNTLDIATALDANQGLFYTVLVSSDFSDDDITQDIATPAVAAAKTIGGLVFTAKTAGTGGNSITVTLSDAVSAGEEIAHASGNAITVKIESGVSTATQIKAAIDDSISVQSLASVAIVSGQAAVAQTAAASQNLTGGAAAIPGAGTGVILGTFKGVTGIASADTDVCSDQAAIENRCAFFKKSANGSKNMFYAFGKLLSNAASWLNQQYITMPLADDVDELGDANTLFDDKVSFVISDDEFGKRLALFACGGKAIVAPYIKRNLEIDLQSAALSYISGNQPAYTNTQAALIEDELKKVMQEKYIDRQLIEAGIVEVSLVEDNFVANAEMNISEPKAFWRIFGEMRQTL
jgi:hypothetical protein